MTNPLTENEIRAECDKAMMGYERIWLEPECCSDPCSEAGRQWSQDPDVWEHDPDGEPGHDTPTQYVRFDLYRDLQERCEELEDENKRMVDESGKGFLKDEVVAVAARENAILEQRVTELEAALHHIRHHWGTAEECRELARKALD